jgi:hypothetical protein
VFPSPQSKPSPVRNPPNRATKFPEEPIKEVTAAFDGGEVNLFDALDAVRAAVEAYQGEAQQQAWRGVA